MQQATLHFNKRQHAEPFYPKAMEIFNAVSHIVGGGLGLLFGVACLVAASFNLTPNKIVAAVVYAVSLVTLYTISALYHFLPQGRAKRVFRTFDHCTIFLLIAGCYTPFCLLPLWGTTLGTVILVAQWVLAVLGIVFNAVGMRWKAIKVLSMVAYIVMGWMMLPALPLLLPKISAACFWCLLLGGVAYTVGTIFYGLGRKTPVMHCVWHLFVVAGSALQFVSVLMLM